MPHQVITICATEDAVFQKQLDRELAAVKRAGLAVVRSAADFTDDKALVAAIDDADAIVVLLTPALVNSPLWDGVAMQAVQAAHEREPMPVIPVLVQPCAWRGSWVARFKGLPRNGRALSEQRGGADAGWVEVGSDLQAVFKSRAPRVRAAAPPAATTPSTAAAPQERAAQSRGVLSPDDLPEIARAYRVLDRYHAALLQVVDSARRATENIVGPLQGSWSPGKLYHPVSSAGQSPGAEEHTPLQHVSYVWATTSWLAPGAVRVVLVHDGDGTSGLSGDGAEGRGGGSGGADRGARPRLSAFATFVVRARTAGDQHPFPWEAADREIASAQGFSPAFWDDGKAHLLETGAFGFRFGGFSEDVAAIVGGRSPDEWMGRLRALVSSVKGG